MKYEDGSEITSADVKHAVLRSIDKETFPNGPAYFDAMLDLPEGYKGPYKSKDATPTAAIETPDDKTIVFHLKEPFAGFDYLAQLPADGAGAGGQGHRREVQAHAVSSGPYMFEATTTPAAGSRLKRNPEWDAETDPNRKALPDEMVVKTGPQRQRPRQPADRRHLDVDIAGTGVQPAALAKVLQQPTCASGRTTRPTPGSGTPRSTRR